jgi:DNA-binding response OmpR family regulator
MDDDARDNSEKSGKTILLADSEQFIVVAYRDGLERAGYDVVVAHNGDEALELAKSAKPDLILLDLMLPKMNGFEVLERLKKSAQLKKVPVIVLTNLSQDSDEAEARGYGIVDFLVKSDISLNDLLSRLHAALS